MGLGILRLRNRARREGHAGCLALVDEQAACGAYARTYSSIVVVFAFRDASRPCKIVLGVFHDGEAIEKRDTSRDLPQRHK
jgi:hypothetical protein